MYVHGWIRLQFYVILYNAFLDNEHMRTALRNTWKAKSVMVRGQSSAGRHNVLP